MTDGFPQRDGRLKQDTLAPIGLLADRPEPVAATSLALDLIGAHGWSSYGWGSHVDVDAEMYTSIRSVLRSLFVTIVRTWDPTVA